MASALAPAAAFPQITLEGHTFAQRTRLAGTELLLNGAGLRQIAVIKGFALAMYLPVRVSSVPEAMAAAGPKRLQMRLLQSVSTDVFVKAFEKGVGRNTPADELPGLRERMSAFSGLLRDIGEVRRGDIVDMDFVPAQGLLFSLNGTRRGAAIPGADLYAALMRVFIGDRPAEAALKQALLGMPAR